MSMNTPLGQILTTKNIKDFEELEQLQAEQYVVAIADNTAGRGGKIKATKLSSSMISTDADNQLIIGSDNKLYAKMSSITDVIDAQNMYETGRVLTDERGLRQLKAIKTSTFDRSKFTVVGSPTITDDGIASGFSAGVNYVQVSPRIASISQNYATWEIIEKFTTPTVSGDQYLMVGTTSWTNLIFLRGSKLCWCLRSTESNNYDLASYQVGTHTFSVNTTYYIKFKYDGAKYSLEYSTDGINFTEDLSVTSNLKLNDSARGIILGTYFASANVNFKGTIDLKQFSITVDGVEVFNGNKTGVDQIKKDDYTVVGSPTISDDGIASDFSASNYLLTKNEIALAKPFNLTVEFTPNSVGGAIIGAGGTGNSGLYNIKLQTSNSIQLQLKADDNTYIINEIVNSLKQFIFGTTYRLLLSFNGNKYTIEIIGKNDNNRYFFKEINSSKTLYINKIGIGIVYTNAGYIPFDGSIDLNAFKIYVDGNLVYQPTLRIPYTQSKTGSKIVNAIYRDRVQDVYEQNGQANYYTLSDNDFTLPMGEIYGMIGNTYGMIEQLRSELWTPSTSTQIDRSKIVNWGIPDYTAGVNIASLPYTAPTNGLVYISLEPQGGTLFINGARVSYVNITYNQAYFLCATAFVAKGDIITANKWLSNAGYSVFYPLKESNND